MILAFVIPSAQQMVITVLALAVIGFCLYLYDTQAPGDSTIKITIKFLVVFFLIVWLLHIFGFI